MYTVEQTGFTWGVFDSEGYLVDNKVYRTKEEAEARKKELEQKEKKK